ncbi:MAG TPA: hypothetical protein DCF68_09880 [Cyanothece sp. UBA12306]|nr:hypothetical protein [Cyanothece sp. UBA12306]
MIQTDGYMVIRNVFSAKEISSLRKTVKNHFKNQGLLANSGLTQPNAAVEVSDLGWLFYHPKILDVMRQLLGQEDIMFTSHCDIHCRTLSAWHKDDGMGVMEGGYFGFPAYDKEDCRVYKVALYLQDHAQNIGGLTVRKGSHKFAEVDKGEEVYIKTKAGDIVVFDVRLNHTGQQDILPFLWLEKPNFLLRKIMKKIFQTEAKQSKKYLKKLYEILFGERLSIFFTYGLPNDYTKNFSVNNMKRQLWQNKNANIFLSPATRQQFIKNNVLVAEEYFSELVNENKS